MDVSERGFDSPRKTALHRSSLLSEAGSTPSVSRFPAKRAGEPDRAYPPSKKAVPARANGSSIEERYHLNRCSDVSTLRKPGEPSSACPGAYPAAAAGRGIGRDGTVA
ncbi:hypothetical protein, partial [Methanoculleus chikugoensis]|uniref:hypothetical protein n=1 Tax=Methanoculleus chikugoensis TaxID=118126 RepID=UPI001FB35A31